MLSYIAGISGAEFSDTSGLSILLLYIPASNEGDGLAHLKLIIFGWSACYGCARGEGFGPKLKHATMQFVAGLAMLPKRQFTTESPLYGIKHVGMAAMLSEWLGVVFLTPSSAGGAAQGAAVAAIWERIRAHEAANEPLPADLALWKKRSGGAANMAIWERIHTLEAANEPLPADLALWKASSGCQRHAGMSSSRQASQNMAEILEAQPRLLQMVATTHAPVDRPPQPHPPKKYYRCMWCDSTYASTSSARRHAGEFHGEHFEASKRQPPDYYSIAF